jgi:hypothetical protein
MVKPHYRYACLTGIFRKAATCRDDHDLAAALAGSPESGQRFFSIARMGRNYDQCIFARGECRQSIVAMHD